MPANLAPVYLDDTRVQLQGDPRPPVSKIVQAGGKGRDVKVVRLASLEDDRGSPVGLDEVIDRTARAEPVYLRTKADFARDESSGLGEQFGAARTGMAGQGATDSAGEVALDKQAKSDFTGLDERNGASNRTYGVGDLAPGGRTGLSDRAGRPPRPAPSGQSAWSGDPHDARTGGYHEGQSTAGVRQEPPSPSEGAASADSSDAD